MTTIKKDSPTSQHLTLINGQLTPQVRLRPDAEYDDCVTNRRFRAAKSKRLPLKREPN